jgi:hypothetical protein
VKPKELLPACFMLFAALLAWPLLTIPNHGTLVAGVPAMVLYLFALWGALVGVLAWSAWRSRRSDEAP